MWFGSRLTPVCRGRARARSGVRGRTGVGAWELEGWLGWLAGPGPERRKPPLGAALVAGVGFEPTTFRL